MKCKKFEQCLDKFVDNNYIDDIEEDHFVFFVMFFVEKYCKSIYENFEYKGRGRPPLSPKNMLVLVLYCYMIKIFSPSQISAFSRTDSVFKLILEGVSVSRSSVSRYRTYFLEHYQEILSKTLLFAYEYDLTDFKRVAVDGTILKACNAPFNYITKKDLRRLLRILKKDKYGVNEVSMLKRQAQKFYYNGNMSVEQKIGFLEYAREQMSVYGKKKIPLYDPDARWMLNKKKKKQISYNIQTCVDTQSHLVMGVYASQTATDHYELPATLDIALENSPVKPEEVLADAAYNTEITFKYLKQEDIEGYIYNATLSRIDKGNRRISPFSLDNTIIHYEENYIECFMGYPLFNKYTYVEKNKKKEEKGIPLETKRIYVNTEACKDCPLRQVCLTQKQHHKTYTISGSPLKRQMKEKMMEEESKEAYKERAPTVESPFGIFKQFYHLDYLFFRGRQKIENMMNLYATAYNLKNIYDKLINILITENDEYINFVKETIDKYKSK